MLTDTGGQVEYGKYAFIYACIPILNVLYTYGMETAFFRYSTEVERSKLYNTQLSAMLITTLFFTGLLYLFRQPLSVFINVEEHVEYVGWVAAIIGLDALAALPYARLRKENRPRKYAITKIAGILVYVFSIVFLYSIAGKWAATQPDSAFGQWYNRHWGVGFILFANILQSVVTLVLLWKELADFRLRIDPKLLQRVLKYGFPILIAGFAGVINDSIDRVMLQKLYPASDEASLRMVGLYTAAVRLSVMINLVIQAFKMAAEPFFFSISKEGDAKQTYARVMKWFVIVMAMMFLAVVLFLDIWKYFVGPDYRDALGLVPVLLLGYVCLGIYYNLTVWYKLTDRTHFGAWIMMIGAAITIIVNLLLIPSWGYVACAWATLLCYAVMMLLSYLWGQKYYPIPYPLKKISGYLTVMLLLFGFQWVVLQWTELIWLRLVTGGFFMLSFVGYILKQDGQELAPIVKKILRR